MSAADDVREELVEDTLDGEPSAPEGPGGSSPPSSDVGGPGGARPEPDPPGMTDGVDVPNVGGTGPGAGSTTPGSDGVGTTPGAITEGAADAVADVVDEARNLGPDWLDEVTVVAVVLAIVAGLLWLARPLLTALAGVTGD